MILPGETEAGSAAMQPCRGIAWWAHRDDDRKRGTHLPRSSQNHIGSEDPNALKIPARRAEFTLTENASFHFTLNRHTSRSGLHGIAFSKGKVYLQRYMKSTKRMFVLMEHLVHWT
jgi:hypothetical protein